MMSWREGWRSRAWRAMAAAMAAGLAALVAACGGGDQVDPFRAARVVAFGDEHSVITSARFKYTVNVVSAAAPTTPDCLQHPLWTQLLAAHYGLVFRECPGANDPAAVRSRTFAVAHTGVAELAAQVDRFFAEAGPFADNDLVTVFTGGNDIRALAQAAIAGATSVDQAVAQAEQLGADLAGQVNRVASLGAKVLVSTVPDQSLTPDGRSDANRGAVLRRLTQRFNARMRTTLINDGRMIGLLLFDETALAIANNPNFNSTDPACDDATSDVAVPDDVLGCTSLTLRTLPSGVTAAMDTWLWADRVRLAPLGHSSLGAIAVTRANNNPF